jgi:hypothetical protein
LEHNNPDYSSASLPLSAVSFVLKSSTKRILAPIGAKPQLIIFITNPTNITALNRKQLATAKVISQNQNGTIILKYNHNSQTI